MMGGVTIDQILDTLSTDEMDSSPLIPYHQLVRTKSAFDKIESCQNGKCDVKNNIYEMHEIDGKKFEFYTLNDTDISQLAELNDDELCSGNVSNNIGDESMIIGLKVDDQLKAYCQYAVKNGAVHINNFCAVKGYGTPLYTFIERFFDLGGFNKIITLVNIKESMADRKINFWYKQGFHTMNIHNDTYLLLKKEL